MSLLNRVDFLDVQLTCIACRHVGENRTFLLDADLAGMCRCPECGTLQETALNVVALHAIMSSLQTQQRWLLHHGLDAKPIKQMYLDLLTGSYPNKTEWYLEQQISPGALLLAEHYEGPFL